MVLAADGICARSSSDPVDWTCKEDRRFFARMTKKAGVVIMGSKTYDAIGKPLKDRKNIVLTRSKQRQSTDPNLVFSNANPRMIINDLEKNGFETGALIGGPTINALFEKENLIDELYLTMVPRFIGQGFSLFKSDVMIDKQLKLLDVIKLTTDTVCLHYKLVK